MGTTHSDTGPKEFQGDVHEETGGFHVLVIIFIVWYYYLVWGTLFV